MASSIPWDALKSSAPLRVLDPMMGSGTTISAARALGHSAIGLDLDPLAVLLTRAWCTSVAERPLLLAARNAVETAQGRAKGLRGADGYPRGADRETRAFVRYWFTPSNRRELRALADAIEAEENQRLQRLLWAAFSRLIITKDGGVSLARDLAHSRPHKVAKTAVRPLEQFEMEVKKILVAARAQAKEKRSTGRVRLLQQDARKLPIKSETIDFAITSPPYLNAIDYLRTSKFTLVWMGHQVSALRKTRSELIGSEVSKGTSEKALASVAKRMGHVSRLPSRQRALLARFLVDMNQVIAEVARVLTPGGTLVLVVADCAVRGVRVRNSVGLTALAKRNGLALTGRARRAIPASRRYLPPPSSGAADLRDRMRTEVVLRFQKIKKRPRRADVRSNQ